MQNELSDIGRAFPAPATLGPLLSSSSSWGLGLRRPWTFRLLSPPLLQLEHGLEVTTGSRLLEADLLGRPSDLVVWPLLVGLDA